jgi:hypothetical protein
VGDCVLSVNGVSVDNVTHQQAVDALRNAGSRVTLVLKRKVPVVQAPLSPKLGGTNLEIVLVKGGKGLGFSIAGGIGNQHISGDDGIFVTKIIDGGAASVDGRLSVGDRIISVNSHNLEGVTHDHAVSVLKATKQTVTLVISKTDPFQFNSQQESSSQSSSKAPPDQTKTPMSLSRPPAVVPAATETQTSPRAALKDPRDVVLSKGHQGLGFNIVGGEDGQGIFISFILAGGAADRSGQLKRGDQILSVNGRDLRTATHEEAAAALKGSGATVNMRVQYNPEEYANFEAKINDMRERAQGAGATPGSLKTSAKKELFVRALFDYDKSKDSGLPSAGLSFRHGDILHVTNASDDEWWQARRITAEGIEEGQGVIPSKKRVERRERSRQKSVKFSKSVNGDDKKGSGRRRSFNLARKIPFFRKKDRKSVEEKPEEAVLSYDEVTQEESKGYCM